MAGESARAKARTTRERAERMLATAEKWEKGAAGEAATGEVLAELGPGWTVWHDLAWPGRPRANIDHVVVGPTGIFVIDSKNWTGSVTVRDGMLRQDGNNRDRAVAGCAEAALAVGSLVPDLLPACRALICFTRDEPVSGTARDVELSSTSTLLATVTSRPPILTPPQVAEAVQALQERLASRSDPPTTQRRPRRQTPKNHRKPARSRRSRLVNGLLTIALLAGGYAATMTIIQQMADRAIPDAVAPTATTPRR